MELHEVAIAQLEAESDLWAEQVNLKASIEHISHISRIAHHVPMAARVGMIKKQKSLLDDLMRQAFIEGAVRAVYVIKIHQAVKPDQT